MKTRLFLVVVAVATLLGPAIARADYAAGKAAYDRGDYETAYRAWLPLAERGDRDAQFELGWLYRSGQGVQQDYDIAIEWLGKSARQGEVQALTALAYMYNNARGLPEDKGKAECLYLVAAESGYANAQWGLHRLRRSKPGIDFSAGQWLDRAAAQGQLNALAVKARIVFLNPLYIDKTEGYYFFLLAARQGHNTAQALIRAEAVKRGGEATKQLEVARKRAAEWRPILEKRRTIPSEVFNACLP